MLDPLFRSAYRELRMAVIWWGLGIGLLLVFTVALWSSISEEYSKMIEQLPEGWIAFFGDVSLTTVEGYLSVEFFSYAPLILAVFAILAGSAALAGEESQGTLDLLLAEPVRRSRLVLAKGFALTAGAGVIVAIAAAMTWATVMAMDIDLSPGRTFGAFALLWPFVLALALLAMLLTLLLPGRAVVGSVLAAYLIASYILDSMSNIEPALADFRVLYITSYYQGTNALAGQIEWAYVIGLIGIVAVAWVACLPLFQRRDIGTQRPFSVSGLLRRRRAVNDTT
ncbi:MAG: ABC transporter permease subunit [Dehalococcoidia bacterium]